MIRGDARITKTRRRQVAMILGVEGIAAAWSCAKSLWFLRPADTLLSFGSRASEPWSSTRVTEISSFRSLSLPLSVGKGNLTSTFRITI